MTARIYVIDHEPSIREVLRDLLEAEGYQVTVDQPDAALLARVRAASPALLLVDVHGRAAADGWTLLQQVRTDPTIGALPVVVMTTDHRWRTANEAMLAALEIEVVPKPFDVTVLVDTLAAVLRTGVPAGRCLRARRVQQGRGNAYHLDRR